MRLHDAALTIRPGPSQTVWQYDTFGNSIALVDFSEATTELVIESTLEIERFPAVATGHLVAEHARHLPLAYSAEEVRDLGGLHERHVPDDDHIVDRWAKGFLCVPEEGTGLPETLAVLSAMSAAIRNSFTYVPRDAYGTQSPIETLVSRSGTCRDFAYLMMEGARSLGLAARFVSGYIYDPGIDAAAEAHAVEGGGATHAWTQIYVPGAGWVHFDPTNALASDEELIPVAIVREPAQASPVSGSWHGKVQDARQLEVQVRVKGIAGNSQ
jgi:transglutaminase-like putative cysteine protease